MQSDDINWEEVFKKTLVYDSGRLLLMHPLDMKEEIDKATAIVRDHLIEFKKKLLTTKKMPRTRKMIKYSREYNRLQDTWAVWSGMFNRIVRQWMKELDERKRTNTIDTIDEALDQVRMKLDFLYGYWWNRYDFIRSQLSGFSSLRGKSSAKGIERGRETLAKLMSETISYDKLHPQFKELLDKIQKLNFETEFKGEKDG